MCIAGTFALQGGDGSLTCWDYMTSDGPGHPTLGCLEKRKLLRSYCTGLSLGLRVNCVCLMKGPRRLVTSRASMDSPGKGRLSLLTPHLHQKEKGRGDICRVNIFFARGVTIISHHWQLLQARGTKKDQKM